MMHSYSSTPSLPPPDQMCKLSFSPLRSPRRRVDHERNNSETISRPRPISIASHSAMAQHSKRASIYVSDASIILAQRTPMVSPNSAADSLLSPSTSETSEAVDHYAILELGPTASADDVKAAYRRLRVVYFSSDATKYRALQAAFDVLMDPEARQVYDKDYQARGADPSSIEEVVELGKHGRKDSAHGDEPAILEEEEEEAERTEDPNWGLKRHHPTHEPLLGTQPYQSYVPIPTSLLPKSRSPTYMGDIAHNALPN